MRTHISVFLWCRREAFDRMSRRQQGVAPHLAGAMKKARALAGFLLFQALRLERFSLVGGTGFEPVTPAV
jgi:hypothetical protein